MSDTQEQSIEEEIQAKGLTAPRVTPEQIEALMRRITYVAHPLEGTTSTFAHAYLDGTFYLATGHSACVSPENYNLETGKRIAMANASRLAQNKLWELEGWVLFRALKEYPREKADDQ